MSEDWRTETVSKIRTLIEAAAPGVTEEAKWKKASNPDGVPTFTLDGLICTVETYKDKVKVTFAKGASLDDPSHVFNASLDAGTRRAVDIRESDPLDSRAFSALIASAVELNKR
ncbi:DUF1801 domain-containing protein [Rhodococcoides kyotonense]|uniref:YdhG-like domain-containing protein n=1 Tax=Rhodococcoides kyotonense TaxID=398843 RepID=A0A239MTH6_9NOCA|nr:DUF1801 domain-containing protein [Rhodococcus kyotonensis]SNT45268.1 hypothetical protein SAMN05421642_12146 [Rhodococcus kyotonensis]